MFPIIIIYEGDERTLLHYQRFSYLFIKLILLLAK